MTLRPKLDPTKDEAAPYVLRAYRIAVDEGRPTHECYRAGVEMWRRFHPDHAFAYASSQAVEVMLRVTGSLRIEA